MKRRIFVIGIIIAAILAFASLGFAAWKIINDHGEAEGEFISYTIIDLNNITNESTKEAFLYNASGMYSETGLGNSTSFTIQINAIQKDEPYDLTLTLFDYGILNGATISSTATTEVDEEVTIVSSGNKAITIANISGATTYLVTYNIQTNDTVYQNIYTNLTSGSDEFDLKVTAGTENGAWTIDKTIRLTAGFQDLMPVAKPIALTGLVYNGEVQTLVNAPDNGTLYNLNVSTGKNAGTYNITATLLLAGYCWEGGDSEEPYSFTATIAKKEITLNQQMSIDFSASVKTWDQFQTAVLANAFTGVISGDTLNSTFTGMHNGHYKYGTVSGSYVAPSTQTEFGSSYNNVIGSTYQGYFSVNDTNYELAGPNTSIIKYKTAKLGSTYYTIEDAFAGSGTISFAGDSSGANTYVTTAFTKLSTSLTGYSSNSSFTLNGRTLIVPFKNATTERELINNSTAVNNVYSVLYINDGITINTSGNATITSAGSLDMTQTYAGNTRTRGVIVNDGIINVKTSGSVIAYGYIKGNGIINLESGSSMQETIRLWGFPGGSASLAAYRDVFVINSYSMHNSSCAVKIYGGAVLNAFGTVYVQGERKASACLIGKSSSSTCLFRPTSDNSSNFVIKKAIETNTTNLVSITGSNQTVQEKDVFEINGNYVDRQLSIDLVYFSLDTNTTSPCPIGLMQIVAKSGTNLTLSTNDYLFLPGSSLTIESGASVNVTNSEVDITFASYNDINTNSQGGDRNFCSASYSNVTSSDESKLLCNGSFTTTGCFGGKIITTSTEATLSFSGNMISNYRAMYYTKTPYYFRASKQTSFNIYNGTEINESIVSSGGQYYSFYQNGVYGFYATSAIISYDSNNNSTYPDKSVTIPSGGYLITNNDLPTPPPSKAHYTFVEWQLNGESALGKRIFAGVTLVAKYNVINYNIVYNDINGGDGTTTNINPVTFNYETNAVLSDPVRGNMVFGGWYLDSNLTIKISMLDGANLVNYLTGTTLNIYASWFAEGTETYTIFFDNTASNGVICASYDTIVLTDDFSWNSYQLPIMTGKDNDYTVPTYFDGWYYNSTKVTLLDESMFDSNNELTLIAQYLDKNILEVKFMGGTIQTVYYKSGYTFTIPNFNLTLSDDSIFIGWLLSVDGDNPEPYISGNTITLTNQNVLEPDIRKYVKVTIGENEYTTVTVTFDSNSYIVTPGNPSTFTNSFNNSNNTRSNGDEFYIAQGSSFKAKYTAAGNSSGNSATITGTTPATALSTSDQVYTAGTSDITITPKGSCVTGETLVLMADGTYKMIKDIRIGDLVYTWNFYSGELEIQPVIMWWNHGTSINRVLKLSFENNKEINVVIAHGFFDLDLNKFIFIDEFNCFEYVGHQFVFIDENGLYFSRLKSINIVDEEVSSYSLRTAYNDNAILEGSISLTIEDFAGITTTFRVNEDLKYDVDYMNQLIDLYGLYTYEEWCEYMPEYIFDMFQCKYYKIYVGLGILKEEDFFTLLEGLFENIN